MYRNARRLAFLSLLLTGLAAMGQAMAQSLPDFTALAKENSPAVVNISTRQNHGHGDKFQMPRQFNIPNLPDDSPLNDLFRHFFEGVPEDSGC